MRRGLRLAAAFALAASVFSCAKKTPEEKLRDAYEAYQRRDPLGAIVLANEILHEASTGTVALRARWLLYNCYLADRNYKECRRVLNQIIDQKGLNDPQGQEAARQKLWTYDVVGQRNFAIEQARSFLDAATTGTAFWAEMMVRYGGYLRAANQLTTARQVLAQVLRSDNVPEPARFQALGHLTACYATTASAESGIEFFGQYLADKPSTNILPNVYMVMGHLASVLDDQKRKDEFFAKSFEIFDEMYKKASGAGKKIEILIRHAWARSFKGDVDKAAELLRKGIEQFPTSPNRLELYYELARLYATAERFDEAVEVCRQIPREFPNHPARANAYFIIGECHRRQKKWDQAVADFQQIIALFPGTQSARRARWEIRKTEYLRRKEAETSAAMALAKLAETTSPSATLTSPTAPTSPGAATSPPAQVAPPKQAVPTTPSAPTIAPARTAPTSSTAPQQ